MERDVEMKRSRSLRRKALSLCLALIMCVGALQVTAFAAEAGGEVQESPMVTLIMRGGETLVTVDGNVVAEEVSVGVGNAAQDIADDKDTSEAASIVDAGISAAEESPSSANIIPPPRGQSWFGKYRARGGRGQQDRRKSPGT